MCPEFNFVVRANLADHAAATRLREMINSLKGVDEVLSVEVQYKVVNSDEVYLPARDGSDQPQVLEEQLLLPRSGMGEVVRAWREYRGLTTARLAELSKIKQPYISQLEKGKIRMPGEGHRMRLAQGLSITDEDLLLRRLPPNPSPDS